MDVGQTVLSLERERAEHVGEALRRARAWMAGSGIGGLVLTRPGAVAWVTGGMNYPRVDRMACTDALWAVITKDAHGFVTNNVDAPRVIEDADPGRYGFETSVVPWFSAGGLDDAAVEMAGLARRELASDSAGGPGRDVAEDLVRLRLAHTETGRRWLRRLGSDAVHAVETALVAWYPGETDLTVQRRVAAELEGGGMEPVVVLVGGDERLQRLRHPMPTGRDVHGLVMVAVVCRRNGLHVAFTRFVCASALSPGKRALFEATGRIEQAVLGVCRPGKSYGDATEALVQAYSSEGFASAWREHYQGGPIGYEQREFELAPGDVGSRWWSTPMDAGHALAWNPSLRGGAKVEGTYLVGAGGLECITQPELWPARQASGRPAGADVLELA